MFKTERQKQIILAVLGLLGFISLLYARSAILISDTAWHIKVGEWIIANKAIPKFDSFSLLSSNLDLNFMAHEWLFGVLIYGVDTFFSLNGLCLVTMLGVFLSYLCVVLKSKSIISALVISVLFIFFGFTGSMTCRPSTFSGVTLVLMGYIFANESNLVKRSITLSVLMLFLANFHGGYATIALVQYCWILLCKSIIMKKIDKLMLLTILLSFVISCINPYGFSIHKYLFIMSADISAMSTDYTPLSLTNVCQIFMVVLVFTVVILGYIKSKEKNVLDLLIVGMYLVMVIRYERMLDIFNYAFILYMSRYFVIKKEKVGVCIAIFSLVFALINLRLPNKTTEAYIRENIIGEDVYTELKGSRFYNTIGSGGYLIYLDEKPFLDTRTDVYIEEFGNPNLYELGYKAQYSDSLMYNLTEKYGLELLLLGRNNLSNQIFEASVKWEVATTSENYIVYKKVK